MLNGLYGSDWNDPKTMATLQMAAGLMSGRNFGDSLSRGLGGYQAVMQNAEESEARKSERAYNDLVRQMKLEEIKKAQEQEARQKNWIASQNPVSRALGAGGGPTAANAAQVNPAQVDAYRLLEAGLLSPAEYAKQFILPKERKVKDFKEVRNPDGSVSIVGLTEDGQVVNTNQTPFKAPEVRDFGGYVGGIDPITGQVRRFGNKTMSPDAVASNAVAWANVQTARDRLAFDKSGGAERNTPRLVDGQWVAPPRDLSPGEVRPATAPTAVKDANDALALIDEAKRIIPQATGSYLGAGVDQVGRVFGWSTKGDDAAAQLKAIEGALVSKMPKMSGPQSDKDVLLYRQMAGEIGDPTVPADRKLAALQTIEAIQQRYSGGMGGKPVLIGPNNSSPAAPGGRPPRLPNDIQNLLNKY